MYAVEEVNVSGLVAGTNAEGIREEIAAIFWAWFNNHRDQKVTTVKFWFISKTVYVRDLYDLFVLLFGHPSE